MRNKKFDAAILKIMVSMVDDKIKEIEEDGYVKVVGVNAYKKSLYFDLNYTSKAWDEWFKWGAMMKR